MSLKQKTIRGLGWSFASQGGKQAFQFVINVILARLLAPQDFGLIAMATVITGFVTIFGDLGFSRALIYKQDLDQDHLSSAFWVNVFFGAVLTLSLILAAPFVAHFYKKPELTTIFVALSLNFILASLTIVQQALITKKMDFKSLTIRDIIAVIVSGVAGIVLAWKGFGVWSLVVQALSYTFMNGILLWLLSPWRPAFKISKKAIKDLFSYSVHVTGFNIFTYLARNIDYLLIGRFLGPQSLGLYTLAYKLMLLPLNNITWVITKVMFPAFSKIQNDLSKVRSIYLRMTKYISLVTFPLMFGLLILAPEFIHVVYGKKWILAIPLVQVMCLCGMLQSVYSTTTSIFLSQGRSQQLFQISVLNCVVVTISVLMGLPWGLLGVACAYAAGQLAWVFYVQFLSNRLISLGLRSFMASMTKSLLIGAIVFVGLGCFKVMFLEVARPTVLIGAIFWGVILYFVLLYVFERKEIKQFWQDLTKRRRQGKKSLFDQGAEV